MKHKKIKTINRGKIVSSDNSTSEYLKILKESKIEDEIIKNIIYVFRLYHLTCILFLEHLVITRRLKK